MKQISRDSAPNVQERLPEGLTPLQALLDFMRIYSKSL
jgi:hypothetical protein